MDASAGLAGIPCRPSVDDPAAVSEPQASLLQPTATGYHIAAVAGRKRLQGGPDAHDLDNTKARKMAGNSTVKPLSLKEKSKFKVEIRRQPGAASSQSGQQNQTTSNIMNPATNFANDSATRTLPQQLTRPTRSLRQNSQSSLFRTTSSLSTTSSQATIPSTPVQTTQQITGMQIAGQAPFSFAYNTFNPYNQDTNPQQAQFQNSHSQALHHPPPHPPNPPPQMYPVAQRSGAAPLGSVPDIFAINPDAFGRDPPSMPGMYPYGPTHGPPGPMMYPSAAYYPSAPQPPGPTFAPGPGYRPADPYQEGQLRAQYEAYISQQRVRALEFERFQRLAWEAQQPQFLQHQYRNPHSRSSAQATMVPMSVDSAPQISDEQPVSIAVDESQHAGPSGHTPTTGGSPDTDEEMGTPQPEDEEIAQNSPDSMEDVDDMEGPQDSSGDRGKSRADGLPSGSFLSEQSVAQPFQLLILERLEEQGREMRKQSQSEQRFRSSVTKTLEHFTAEVTELKDMVTAGPKAARTKSVRPKLAPVKREQAQSADQAQGADADDADDKAHHSRFSSCVRMHLRLMLGIRSTSELLQKFPPLTEEQVQAINDGAANALQCTENAFRIDFVQGWKSFPLNMQARSVFIKHFRTAVAGGSYSHPPLPEALLQKHQVGIALDTYMDHCRASYQTARKPDGKALKATRNKQKAVNSRRQTTFNTRIDVITRREKLKRHLALFSKLAPANLSEDETDGGIKTVPPKWRIVNAEWMSHEMRMFMFTLDTYYRGDWRNSRATGNPPRARRMSNGRTKNIRAPKGLWKNCYNADWLAKLPRHELEDLEIIDALYDFTIPDDIDDQTPQQRAMLS